ncbi:cytochrome c oxidase subunit 3 [Granulicella tundricola]|uniref:Cytochrome c oxidase subunit III n=1 Tax=Granulicella tundricola (strain ATCC BAA-1859 / DSM 23138 / MP5ACTX9) TaxID=1198114 RepID=E8X2I2_GRATM|nr:heme-copper oxidase subunit III [Granulicella tundricola]ADW69206.1 cytochrome c oxidase subunit III [Granulicella tundricola MP5ACTX9]
MSSQTTTGSSSFAETYAAHPSKGLVGILCLIVAETTIFVIFVVAYIFYLGKSLSGPAPHEVLSLPIVATVCLLSSSLTVHQGVAELRKGKSAAATFWIGITALLGLIFLGFTGAEWFDLIVHHGLTIKTNLFGTTFYSLVGLHATHVVVGLIMLLLVTFFGLNKQLEERHAERLEILSLYWHFVDAVWVIVFCVVYLFGR